MKIRILIADDHPIVRRGLRSLLESQPNCEVVGETINGREAVTLAKRLRPDIVILDITMPDLNGLEATRQILKENPGTEVLILTMHYSEELARQVLHAGARGFVLKSDADDKLLEAVDTLRQHKPYLAPDIAEVVLRTYLDAARSDTSEASHDRLTPREREVLQMLAEGRTNKEVATKLRVSPKTIEIHRANIMNKLNLRSLSDLVRYAIRNQLVEP